MAPPKIKKGAQSKKSAPSKKVAPPTLEAQRERMGAILRVLEREYPEAECSLSFGSPFQLLCATILSAQCTDARVNQVTPELFGAYPDAPTMARAPLPKLEALIRTTGFFKNKALALREASRAIVDSHGGQVPEALEDLVKLRGVGRKTANVVRGVAFGFPGLVVDTHVGRLSRRMGFTTEQDPVKVETQMMAIVPEAQWTHFGHLLIDHGRAVCDAKRPRCTECPVAAFCPKILAS